MNREVTVGRYGYHGNEARPLRLRRLRRHPARRCLPRSCFFAVPHFYSFSTPSPFHPHQECRLFFWCQIPLSPPCCPLVFPHLCSRLPHRLYLLPSRWRRLPPPSGTGLRDRGVVASRAYVWIREGTAYVPSTSGAKPLPVSAVLRVVSGCDEIVLHSHITADLPRCSADPRRAMPGAVVAVAAVPSGVGRRFLVGDGPSSPPVRAACADC